MRSWTSIDFDIHPHPYPLPFRVNFQGEPLRERAACPPKPRRRRGVRGRKVPSFVFLVGLCCVLLHVNVCRGADKAMPMDDVRVPLEYYEDGRIKSQLFSDSAKIAPEGDIEAVNPRVEFYGKDKNVEILMKAEECRYNRDNRTAVSKSNIRLEKEDVVITGTGLNWDGKEQSVKILDNARVVLKEGIRQKRSVALAEEAISTGNLGTKEEGTNITVITSEYLTFDYKRSIAVFEGNVVVADPQIRIESDKMNVLFNEDNSVKSMTALGNVHLWQGDKTATCRRAVYFARTGEVMLMGKAVLRDPKGLAEGEKIRYLIDEGKVSCEPARLVIFPDAKRSGFKHEAIRSN